jgi:tetratricopeptide (TPR) repeat protein
MGNAERALGRFDAALRQYDLAMGAAGTPEERAQVHGALETYYESRGQMELAIEHLEQRLAEEASYLPGLYALIGQLGAVSTYVEAGREAEAFAMVEGIRSQVPPPFDAMAAIGDLNVHLARNDAEALEATLPAIEAIITNLQFENVRPALIHARARMHELRGEYREAIEEYEEERRLDPTDMTILRQLGRCYRELGDSDQSLALLEEALRVSPYGPRINYEIALTYEAMGRMDDARTHLERALEVWADADPGFERAARAREKLAELASGN